MTPSPPRTVQGGRRKLKASKKNRKIACELFAQIESLTFRWHINFSTPDREVIRAALLAYIEEASP